MSDHIAVMSDGRVQQIGTPREVYEEPETTFVADFLGVSNLMAGEADGRDACASATPSSWPPAATSRRSATSR